MTSASFRFKQFSITQNKSAFKVGTDACILGAWINPHEPNQLLDIGTGTGVLALMAAQRFPQALITAIDIDSDSAFEASENAKQSPFSNRLRVMHASLETFLLTEQSSFDCIICNPPFFSDGPKSPDQRVARARHSIALDLTTLLRSAKGLLNPNGKLNVILPVEQREAWTKSVLAYQYCETRVTWVRSFNGKPFHRFLSCVGPEIKHCIEDELVIYERMGEYTRACRELLRAFYLKL